MSEDAREMKIGGLGLADELVRYLAEAPVSDDEAAAFEAVEDAGYPEMYVGDTERMVEQAAEWLENNAGRVLDARPRRLEAHGSGTEEDPIHYEINEALCRAVKEGDWNTTMLKNLADWALRRLEADSESVHERIERELARLEDVALAIKSQVRREEYSALNSAIGNIRKALRGEG